MGKHNRVFLAVLFAYWTNCKFVFQVPFTKKSFFEFVGMRIGTILIDNGGMLLMTWLNWNDIFAKVVVNIIIIGLNYLFSKLFIFRK